MRHLGGVRKMDEIGTRREERRCALAQDFLPIFGNGEDAILAATMLVMALAAPISEEDRPRYLAALERLPKGIIVSPWLLSVSEGADRHWLVTFTDGHTDYKSLRHFPTIADAGGDAINFLVRLRGEIGRP